MLLSTRGLLTLLLIISINFCGAQPKSTDKMQIKKMLNTFMECLTQKDSTTFSKLFYDGPVAWVGTYKQYSQQQRLKKDKNADDNFYDTYQSFIRYICKDSSSFEEKFNDIKITEDGSVATVTFDYSFWANGKMENWGSEYWSLAKANNVWKITSVLFSMELTEYLPPVKKERVNKRNKN